MSAALPQGSGLRTTTTSALDEDIPNSFAGTTSEISTMTFVECPTTLDLTKEVLSGIQVLEAIEKITTSTVEIAADADITFVVGQSAELGNETSVGSNATFAIVIDPSADCIP